MQFYSMGIETTREGGLGGGGQDILLTHFQSCWTFTIYPDIHADSFDHFFPSSLCTYKRNKDLY